MMMIPHQYRVFMLLVIVLKEDLNSHQQL